ncbi:hypothetical protein UK82_24900 [Frankia sp. ACN1ag]|nr:hypothetical protein UK82_24900 [Frankia sp. ACN1ag]
MTVTRTTGPLDSPDDHDPRETTRGDATRPEASERVGPTGAVPVEEPPAPVEEPREAPGADVRALPSRTEADGGGGRTGRRWVFYGEVQTISGPEADRIRAELADVIRDLLRWAAGEGAADGGALGEEAA